jgi:hypothetical protein
MQPVPQGKAPGDEQSDKDADQEKPAIRRERYQKNAYNEDGDEKTG